MMAAGLEVKAYAQAIKYGPGRFLATAQTSLPKPLVIGDFCEMAMDRKKAGG
jgi:hypothetical protein